MGTREFTDADERSRRVALVEAVGHRAYGASWQTPLAEALSSATGRTLGRARVAQWMLATDPKPVPAWVLDALPAIARDGAAQLRKSADELDALFSGGGAPPVPRADPAVDFDGTPPQESGPAAGQADETDRDLDLSLATLASSTADEEEFDMDSFVERFAHVRLDSHPQGGR